MSNNSSSSGVGFLSLLTLLFITLKLLGKIDWSWWWVLSPTLFGAAFAIVILVIVAIATFRR